MKTIPYSRLICCLFLCFSFIAVNAQSKKVQEELEEAEDFYYDKKYAAARDIYLKHTRHLSNEHEHHLGISLLSVEGKKSPEEITTGFSWIRKAADAGNPEAMRSLFVAYNKGIMLPKDSVQALHWLTKAANAGDKIALGDLGYYYEIGKGVPRDLKKAKELYIKAANLGDEISAFSLGTIAQEEGNMSSALHYLKQSANRGYSPALLLLGEIYEKGTGLGHKDPDEAVRWYSKIKNTKKNAADYAKADAAIRRIGRTEPPADMSIVKPLLLKLIGKAGNEFSGLLGQTVQPVGKENWSDIYSESEYYACTVDLGFKNAVIKKEVVKDQDLGNGYRTRAGTFYSYSADIVHSLPDADAKRVFSQWVAVLKETVPQWQGREGKHPDNGSPTFTISGKISNGKTVVVYMQLCCPANSSKSVHLNISSE